MSHWFSAGVSHDESFFIFIFLSQAKTTPMMKRV